MIRSVEEFRSRSTPRGVSRRRWWRYARPIRQAPRISSSRLSSKAARFPRCFGWDVSAVSLQSARIAGRNWRACWASVSCDDWAG